MSDSNEKWEFVGKLMVSACIVYTVVAVILFFLRGPMVALKFAGIGFFSLGFVLLCLFVIMQIWWRD